MAPNVLAVGPRDCIMLEGNPITKERLEDAGCRVRTYHGDEISLKAEGGATCLTRPVLRPGESRDAEKWESNTPNESGTEASTTEIKDSVAVVTGASRGIGRAM